MILLLLIASPATYLMRVCGLLLARTRLVPQQMESALALVSTAVLAALVAPSLLRPAGPLAANPLDNPRLLVALLLLPLILLLRRRVQAMLLLTLLAGMGLLWGLRWLPDTTITLALPLGLLLVASAGLVLLLVGSVLAWFRLTRRTAGPGLGATTHTTAVTVTPVEERLLPTKATSLSAQKPAGAHLHCPWCWCPLPVWALYCGQCGLPQQAPAFAVTQPLSAVTVTPAESERAPTTSNARGERTNYLLALAGASGARTARGQDTARNGGTSHRLPEKGGS